jgi:hypothetical protein
MTRWLMSAAVLAIAVAAPAGIAHADLSSSNVISAFRGQLVVSKDELPEGKNDRETIQKIKAVQLKELVGAATGEGKDDVVAWHFHYTAFLTRTGAKSLKLEFMNGKQLSADQRLSDVDPKNAVLSGDISIDEDQGLNKGRTYTVQLVTDNDQVVCTTQLTMK